MQLSKVLRLNKHTVLVVSDSLLSELPSCISDGISGFFYLAFYVYRNTWLNGCRTYEHSGDAVRKRVGDDGEAGGDKSRCTERLDHSNHQTDHCERKSVRAAVYETCTHNHNNL